MPSLLWFLCHNMAGLLLAIKTNENRPTQIHSASVPRHCFLPAPFPIKAHVMDSKPLIFQQWKETRFSNANRPTGMIVGFCQGDEPPCCWVTIFSTEESNCSLQRWGLVIEPKPPLQYRIHHCGSGRQSIMTRTACSSCR